MSLFRFRVWHLLAIGYLGAGAYFCCLYEAGANDGARLSVQEAMKNLSAHAGKVVEITGRVAGTIVSERGRTVMIDTGGSNVFVRDVPDSPLVRNYSQVTIVARVPVEGSTEFEFISAAPPKPVTAAPAKNQKPIRNGLSSANGNSMQTTMQANLMMPSDLRNGNNHNWTRPVAPATPITIDNEVIRLKPAYSNAIRHFNRRLSAARRDEIAEAVLRFSLANKLDPRLTMSVIAVESAFRPGVTSRCGAMGLGQLMPGTAAGLGVRNAFDPIDNVRGAVRLIRGHLEKYSGSPDAFNLALAAYNAGPGAVRKYGGVPPYRETVNYLWKIYRLYKQLAPDAFRST